VTTSCKKLPESINLLINYIQKIANDPAKWFKLISSNAYSNSMSIMWNLYSLDSLVKTEKFKDVGTKLGEVFKWVFKVNIDTFSLALFTMPQDNTPKVSPSDIVKCVYAVVQDGGKLYSLVEDATQHPENLPADFIQIVAVLQDLQSNCKGIFNFNLSLVALSKKKQLGKKSGKFPPITDIYYCLKSIQPLAVDIYGAVKAYEKGDNEDAMRHLTQAGIDAVGVATNCWKVIQEILSDKQ